jgi:predicted MFS family arabinose efflux permease
VLIASRVFVGITIGGFWAVAGSLAVRLVPGPYVARAMVLIFGGMSAAAVLGVPVGTILGEWLGWRAAFGSLAALSAAVLAAALVFLPRLPAAEGVRPVPCGRNCATPRCSRASRPRRCWLRAYTFVSPALLDISGVGGGMIGVLLLGYGVFGTVANVIAGPRAARSPGRTEAVIAAVLGV